MEALLYFGVLAALIFFAMRYGCGAHVTGHSAWVSASRSNVTPQATQETGGVVAPAVLPRLPVVPLGLSLGIFLAITYGLCVVFDLMFPGQAMYLTWLRLLPGFTWLTWPSFFLGLIESFAYGWYVALIFAPLFNFFAHVLERRGRT
jgi:hypothetical protein